MSVIYCYVFVFVDRFIKIKQIILIVIIKIKKSLKSFTLTFEKFMNYQNFSFLIAIFNSFSTYEIIFIKY